MTIWIPSCPNSDSDKRTIQILTSKMYSRFQIWYSLQIQPKLTKIDLFSTTRSKKSIKRSKKSIKRSRKSITRSKKLNIIVKVLRKSIYINFFDQIWYIFNLFQSILNFLILPESDLIKFVTTIWILMTNSDQKNWLKDDLNLISDEF